MSLRGDGMRERRDLVAERLVELLPWARVETAMLGYPFIYLCIDNVPRARARYVVWDARRGARVWEHVEPMSIGRGIDGNPKFTNRRRVVHSEPLGHGGGANYVERIARRLADLAEEHVRHAAPAAEGEAA